MVVCVGWLSVDVVLLKSFTAGRKTHKRMLISPRLHLETLLAFLTHRMNYFVQSHNWQIFCFCVLVLETQTVFLLSSYWWKCSEIFTWIGFFFQFKCMNVKFISSDLELRSLSPSPPPALRLTVAKQLLLLLSATDRCFTKLIYDFSVLTLHILISQIRQRHSCPDTLSKASVILKQTFGFSLS